ncbi:hypothetical protein HanRHA438_Chr06g0256541 [Helianthus annuus]|nr:hypothetical protein HanRHA438_Chr06g0256541 [Helianthus annuus]
MNGEAAGIPTGCCLPLFQRVVVILRFLILVEECGGCEVVAEMVVVVVAAGGRGCGGLLRNVVGFVDPSSDNGFGITVGHGGVCDQRVHIWG